MKYLAMSALPILWLLTPFVTAIVIGNSPRLRGLAGRFWVSCVLIGWIGVGMLVAAAFLLDGPIATVALVAGGPLAGLSFWLPHRGDGDDGPGPDADDPEPPPPGGDWERFEGAFWDYVDAREAHSRRERQPA